LIVVNPVGNKLTILRKADLSWEIGLVAACLPCPSFETVIF